jgi:acylphosphatase
MASGVGFRFFTRKKAQAYNLTGWCRNTPDDKVREREAGDLEEEQPTKRPGGRVTSQLWLTYRGDMMSNTKIQVEGEIQGPSEDVKKLLGDINEGPRHSKVVKLTTEARDVVEGEAEFAVRH